MLNTDVRHKVVHEQTCLDEIMDLYHSHGGNFQSVVERRLLGQSVLTRLVSMHVFDLMLLYLSAAQGPEAAF